MVLTRSITANWYRGKGRGLRCIQKFLKTFQESVLYKKCGRERKEMEGKCAIQELW